MRFFVVATKYCWTACSHGCTGTSTVWRLMRENLFCKKSPSHASSSSTVRARNIWVEFVCSNSLLSAETFVSKGTIFYPLTENQHSICSALIRIGVMFILKFSHVIRDLIGNLKFETLQFE